MISPLLGSVLLAALLAGACGRDERQASEEGARTGEPTPEGARTLRLGGEFFRDNLLTYIRRFEDVQRVPADSLAARMPAHRQLLADVLVQIEREMQGLGVMGDARWSALADSLRRDLTTITQLEGVALRGFLVEHQRRVRRLLDLHADMMAPVDSLASNF